MQSRENKDEQEKRERKVATLAKLLLLMKAKGLKIPTLKPSSEKPKAK